MRPLDAQTLGISYLLSRGRYLDALKVRAYIESGFRRHRALDRQVQRDRDVQPDLQRERPVQRATGPTRRGGPDVLWFEGTAQANFVATGLLGLAARDGRQGAGRLAQRDDRARRRAAAGGPHRHRQPDQRVPRVARLGGAPSWAMIAAEGLPD